MTMLRSHSLPCPDLSNYAPSVSHQDCFPCFAFTSNGTIASKSSMSTLGNVYSWDQLLAVEWPEQRWCALNILFDHSQIPFQKICNNLHFPLLTVWQWLLFIQFSIRPDACNIFNVCQVKEWGLKSVWWLVRQSMLLSSFSFFCYLYF